MGDAAFAPDAKLQEIAEAYALDAVEFAREHFRLDLDWSDESVEQVESIAGRYHDKIAQTKPSEEQIYEVAKMLGSYVGEVFRRNYGASWGMVTLAGKTFPGMQPHKRTGMVWPWGRVQKRLVEGAENNVWHYYLYLREKYGDGTPMSAEG